jgi:hypothetical protein
MAEILLVMPEFVTKFISVSKARYAGASTWLPSERLET